MQPVQTPGTGDQHGQHGPFCSAGLSVGSAAPGCHISSSRSCPPGPWAGPPPASSSHEQPCVQGSPAAHTMNSMASNYSINGSHRLNNQVSIDSSGSVGGLGVPSLTAASRAPPMYSEGVTPRTTGLFQATGTTPSFTSHNSHS